MIQDLKHLTGGCGGLNELIGLTSRKINKFITRKTLKDKEKLKVSAENFVNEVKP